MNHDYTKALESFFGTIFGGGPITPLTACQFGHFS